MILLGLFRFQLRIKIMTCSVMVDILGGYWLRINFYSQKIETECHFSRAKCHVDFRHVESGGAGEEEGGVRPPLADQKALPGFT